MKTVDFIKILADLIERGKKRTKKSKYTIEFPTAAGTLEPLNYYQKGLYLENARSS